MPIFLKVNHQLESRMQEICQSGSEGGAKLSFVPTPISAQGFNPVSTLGSLSLKRRALKLKGRKEGLAWRSRNNVMFLLAISKSAALFRAVRFYWPCSQG
jgi:hypothetical protein